MGKTVQFELSQGEKKVLKILLYFQVRSDYLRKEFDPSSSLDVDVAVQLCCLELRRFFKDMPQGGDSNYITSALKMKRVLI